MMDREREEKIHKKLNRIARTAVWSLGLGIGLLIARYIAPLLMGDSAVANDGFSGFGFLLLGYGASQLAVLAFMRRHATKICPVITYIIMPAVLLKLIADISG